MVSYYTLDKYEKAIYMHKKEFKKLRERLLKQNNYRCSECRKYKDNWYLVIHHKDHNWRNNKINNLVVLCRSCHQKLHCTKY